MNLATRRIASVFGFLVGIGGLDHGFFEALHGNIPTTSLFVQSIGPANRFWVYGTEDAFTLVPNFLVTGILAMVLSVVVIVWSAKYIHQKNSPLILTLLFISLFLVGGGVAQIGVFILVMAVATQINRPLTGWSKVLPEGVWKSLAKVWPYSLGIGVLLFVIALEIAIFGFVPGVNNPDLKQYICWSFLGVGLVFFLLTIMAGFASDIQANNRT